MKVQESRCMLRFCVYQNLKNSLNQAQFTMTIRYRVYLEAQTVSLKGLSFRQLTGLKQLLNWAQTRERPCCLSSFATCILARFFAVSSHTAHMLLVRVNLPDWLFRLMSHDRQKESVIVAYFVCPSTKHRCHLVDSMLNKVPHWSRLKTS